VTIDERLKVIQSMLAVLVERQMAKEFYEIDEFARIVGRSVFTCREWCRHGRVLAAKKNTGRGPHAAWIVSHAELRRYQQEGLLEPQSIVLGAGVR